MTEYPSIQCPRCKMVSYYNDDIKYKYCNNCHEWHEFMNDDAEKQMKKTIDELNAIFKNQPKYCEFPACMIQHLCEHWHKDEFTITFRKPERVACPQRCEEGRIPVDPLGYKTCPVCNGHGTIKT